MDLLTKTLSPLLYIWSKAMGTMDKEPKETKIMMSQQIESMNRDRIHKKEPNTNSRVQKYNNGNENFTREI